MSFEVNISTLTIANHPDADALEIAVIGGYNCIVRKGQYKDGDFAAYIPEDSVVPEDVLGELGLTGKLAGSKRNRVKAIRLRGVLSQGLLYPVKGHKLSDTQCEAGLDVKDQLGIVKYVPEIPTHMEGEIEHASGMTIQYELENLQKYPELMMQQQVMVTEKIHGTWCCFGWNPEWTGEYIVSSKGMSSKGMILKLNEANENNLYVKTFNERKEDFDDLRRHCVCNSIAGDSEPFYLLGEFYGKGVQDLGFGKPKGAFSVFDIYIGKPRVGSYLHSADAAELITNHSNFDFVPIIADSTAYCGIEDIQRFAAENSNIDATQMMEGVVVRARELDHLNEYAIVNQFGKEAPNRMVLKYKSERYLTRRGGTEYI